MGFVTITDVSISYHSKQAVKSCSFEIMQDEVFGLLGSNGSGKSSMLKTICGLNTRYTGSIRIDGKDIASIDLSRLVGFVPQDYAFFKEFTVADNLGFFARLYGLQGSALEQKTNELAQGLGLNSFLNVPAGRLSGGYQRLLNIALSLINSPHLLLLDEPSVGLDVSMRRKMWNVLKNVKESGCTVVITTHYLEEAASFCDRIALMDSGTIHAIGEVKELVRQHGGNSVVVIDLDGSAAQVFPLLSKASVFLDSSAKGNTLLLECTPANTVEAICLASEAIARLGARVVDTKVIEPDLNDVFEKVVGHTL